MGGDNHQLKLNAALGILHFHCITCNTPPPFHLLRNIQFISRFGFIGIVSIQASSGTGKNYCSYFKIIKRGRSTFLSVRLFLSFDIKSTCIESKKCTVNVYSIQYELYNIKVKRVPLYMSGRELNTECCSHIMGRIEKYHIKKVKIIKVEYT